MQGSSRTSMVALRERFDRLPAGTDLTRLADALFSVVHVLDESHTLRRAMADPATPADGKAALVHGLFDGKVGAEAADLVAAAAGLRWSTSAELADGLEQLGMYAVAASAEAGRRLDEVEDDLFRFGRIVEREPRLRSALTDRTAPAESRRGLVGDLLEGKAAAETVRLVAEVVVHPRGRSLERGLDLCGQIVAQRRQRLVALVRSAIPLTEQQKSRLAAALTEQYGHEVHLNTEVDPRVVGGLSVHVGDDVIDGTVAGRLEDVRRRLG